MSDAIRYELLGDIAVLAAANPPVNALGQAVRQGLIDGIERAEKDAAAARVSPSRLNAATWIVCGPRAGAVSVAIVTASATSADIGTSAPTLRLST